jgi:biopolymer transport protein ExbD
MAEFQISDHVKRRAGSVKRIIRVDLTPMVDLGFLLITFFVFTTTMAESKVMNFNQPAAGPPRDVPVTGALTVLSGDKNNMFYYVGFFHKDNVVPVTLKQLRQVLTEKRKTTSLEKLMVIIKTSEMATFGNVVNIVDEMSIANIPVGNYIEAELSDDERLLID